MIKLKNILLEGKKEKAAMDYLSKMIKKSPFKGKVYVAGGAVRDELLGLPIKDIDLVVSTPDGGIKFAEWITKKIGKYKSGSNPVTYPKFGTAKFQLYGVKHKGVDLSELEIEAVMARTEKYTKGSRKPEVGTGTLKQDVERRDFTVNSLLKDLTTGEILDFTGQGKNDIRSGIIQTPMDPDIIFTEDPLRMLRAIRFTVKYNWKLPMFMIRALKKNALQLKNISMERIRDELDKMLVTGYPDKAVKLMRITGLSKFVIPELDKLHKLKQNKFHKWSAGKHTLEVLKNVPPDLTTRLAALFHDIGKSATKTVVKKEIHFYEHERVSGEITRDIMMRLKYPSNIINVVVKIVSSHMRTKQAGPKGDQISDKALRKLKRDLGDHLEATLDVIASDNNAHHPDYNMPDQIPGIRNRLKDLDMGQGGKIVLPVNGNDIMKKFNLNPGPLLGVLLKAVEEEYLENPRITRSQAMSVVKNVLRKYK